MSNNVDVEVGRVYAHLKNIGLFVSLDWVAQCIEFLREDSGLSGDRLILGVQEQWLTTDISTPDTMDHSTIPRDFSSIQKFTLNGKISLQVNYGYDIGNPAYGQLQKIYKMENENTKVSAEDNDSTQSGYHPSQGRFVASWEPKPSRMLSLNLTDGFQTFTAFEHQTIGVLPNDVVPGLKIELFGPLVCRRGKIFLTTNSVRVLGGEVEDLAERLSTKNVLTQKIGRNMDEPAFGFQRPGAKPITGAKKPRLQQNIQQPENILPPRQPPDRPGAPSTTATNGNEDIDWGDDADWDDDFQVDDALLAAVAVDVPRGQERLQPQSASYSAPNRFQSPGPSIPTHFNNQLPGPSIPTHHNTLPGPSTPSHQNVIRDYKHQSSPSPGFFRPPLRNISNPDYTKHQPVARVHPLTVEKSTKTPKKTIQTSIASFLRPKEKKTTTSRDVPVISRDLDQNKALDMPDFDLDVDFDKLDELELPEEPKVVDVSPEPFIYLSQINQQVQLYPGRRFCVTIKAVSSTLAGAMKVRKTESGPRWFIALYLNDGSDYIQAELSPDLLDAEVGCAADYATLPPDKVDVKLRYKENIKKLSLKLANLSGLVKLRFPGGDCLPVIEVIHEVTSLHLAKLRRRKLQE